MLEASPAHLEREGCRGSRSFADEQFVDLLQPSVLFLQLTQPPGLVYFQAPILRLPVVERGFSGAPFSFNFLTRCAQRRLTPPADSQEWKSDAASPGT